MAVFNAREVAPKQSGAALDVALGKSPLAAVGFDDFADVDLWFLFGTVSPNRTDSLVANSRSGKGESVGVGSQKVTAGESVQP